MKPKKYRPIPMGSTVRTTKANEELREEWQPGVWEGRQWGVEGIVIKHCKGYGLCLEVSHPDKTTGFYDSSELEEIKDPDRRDRCRATKEEILMGRV